MLDITSKKLLDNSYLKNITQIFSLFGSLSTLFCCALPVLFVSLGLGASFAGLTSAIPQINWLLQYKIPLFIITGFLLVISYGLIWYSKKLSCPEASKDAVVTCEQIKPKTQWIFWIAVMAYAGGILFSYFPV